MAENDAAGAALNQHGVQPGDVLAGKYRVDRVLGAGGMGLVVQATHTVLDSRVALKFLLPEFLGNENVVARFLREARAAVSIKNTHVAAVTDVGTLEGGSPYMVMEYLEGSDLQVLLKSTGKLGTARAADLMLQVCEALACAHAAGIVHRDIKPGNLFITRAGDGSECLKVLDFGISKVESDTGALTRTAVSMGSPLYMAPEQMRNARGVDARADIWSLGVVGFEALTGRLPYEAESMTELVALVLECDPPRVRDLHSDMDPGMDEVIATALQRSVDDRYSDIAAFAKAIAEVRATPEARAAAGRVGRILAGAGSAAQSRSGTADPYGLTESDGEGRPSVDGMESSFIRTVSKAGRSPQSWIIGPLLILIAALAAFWFRPDAAPAPAAAPMPAQNAAEARGPGAAEVETEAAERAALEEELKALREETRAAPVAPAAPVEPMPAHAEEAEEAAKDTVAAKRARAVRRRRARAPSAKPATPAVAPVPEPKPVEDVFSERK